MRWPFLDMCLASTCVCASLIFLYMWLLFNVLIPCDSHFDFFSWPFIFDCMPLCKSLATYICVSCSLTRDFVAASSSLGIFPALDPSCVAFLLFELWVGDTKTNPLCSPQQVRILQNRSALLLLFQERKLGTGLLRVFQIKATPGWEGVGMWVNKSVRKLPTILNVASCLVLCLVALDFCFLRLL